MKIENSHEVLIIEGDEVESLKKLAPEHTYEFSPPIILK